MSRYETGPPRAETRIEEQSMARRDSARSRKAPLLALVAFGATVLASCSSGSGSGSGAAIKVVKGNACGYTVNIGLFGGPQSVTGCGQPANAPAAGASPLVALPEGGSAKAITASSPRGTKAQYGPAVIFGGQWPKDVGSAPPSGPISVSTKGTPAARSVTSSVDMVLRSPPDPASPGGFGPPPVHGDELHLACSASDKTATGSTRFVHAMLATSTDAEGDPVTEEPIPDNPPVNYTRSGVITNVGDVFNAVFNQQIVNADGSLTVNAVHMYLFGPTAVGEIIKGQVTCGTTPSKVTAKDTVPPSCSSLVVVPKGPDNPAPVVPRQETMGVFDAGGLQPITNIKVTNGAVQVGRPDSAQAYLKPAPNQTGPLPVIATRSAEAEKAGLPLTWSFDVTDSAGNTTHCPDTTTPTTAR